MDIACLPGALYKRTLQATRKNQDTGQFAAPVIVKPCLLGSSIGIGRAEDEQALLSALG